MRVVPSTVISVVTSSVEPVFMTSPSFMTEPSVPDSITTDLVSPATSNVPDISVSAKDGSSPGIGGVTGSGSACGSVCTAVGATVGTSVGTAVGLIDGGASVAATCGAGVFMTGLLVSDSPPHAMDKMIRDSVRAMTGSERRANNVRSLLGSGFTILV